MTHINGLLSRQAQRARAVHIAQLLANEVTVAAAARGAGTGSCRAAAAVAR
jgi:hypothetical protein